MPDTEPSHVTVRALVAAHGTLAVGLVSAIEQITGRGAVFRPLSNSQLGLGDIQEMIARALDETAARVIFTDLPAGSCTMAVRRLMRVRPDLTLVTGANLPLLLDFAMQDDVDPVVAAQTALERGRTSMVAFGA